jgi:O-antigen ligase
MKLDERLRFGGKLGWWLFAGVTLLSIAAQNVVFLGLGSWLAWRWQRGLGWPEVPAVLRWALPFLAWALLASWLGENRAHSLETWRRWLLLFLAVYAVGALDTRRSLNAVLGSLLGFSALWCLGASALALAKPFWAWQQGMPFHDVLTAWPNASEWRAVSGSGGYMVLGSGSMLLLCFFSGLMLEEPRWRRPLPLLCLGALALALLLTQTRSAWLGAALGLGPLLLLKRPRLALTLGAAVLALALWPGSPLRNRLAQAADPAYESGLERRSMSTAALTIVRERPWLGVGDSMESWDGQQGWYLRAMPDWARQNPRLASNEQGHLHSIYGQVAAMYGLPGLLLLLLFAIRLAAEAWARRRSDDPLVRGLALGLLTAWAAWWVNGALEYNFGSTQSSFTVWALWGLGLAAFSQASPAKDRR